MDARRDDIARHFIRQEESTHNAAAQASAGRLLILLRKDFLQENADDYLAAEEAGYLASLDALISASDDSDIILPKPKKDIPYINSMVYFINYILSSDKPPFNDPDKRKIVFRHIRQLVTLGKDHWTKNAVFDGEKVAEIDVSLGETLGLVCCALIGDSSLGYKALHQAEEADKETRLHSLFNELLRLANNPKCTGGQQHDLLFLLNYVYPELVDAQQNIYQPIKLVEDEGAFIYDSMCEYIGGQIKQAFPNPELLFRLTRDWIQYQCRPDMVAELPVDLASFFERIDHQQLKEHLASQLSHYGLNPNHPRILKIMNDYTNSISEMSVPGVINPVVPLIVEIFSCRQSALSSGLSIDSSRGEALNKIIDYIQSASSFEELKAPLENFLSMEHAYQQLKNYQHMGVFIGGQEGEFSEAIKGLQEALVTNFTAMVDRGKFQIGEGENSAFNEAKKAFLKQENEFKKHTPIDFINNFFALLALDKRQINALCDRLLIEDKKQSLLLTDNEVNQWLSAVNQEGLVDVTPYQVNRILLHALLSVFVRKEKPLTDLFKQALLKITEWLMSPPASILSPAEARAERLFRDAYPKLLLAGLCYIGQGNVDVSLDAEMLRLLVGSQLVYLLGLPEGRLSNGNKRFIWEAVKGRLGGMIQDGNQLAGLLSLPEGQLPDASKQIVWEAVKDQLAEIIQDGDQLAGLLSLPEGQLSDANKQIIWKAVEGRLDEIVQDGHDLKCLLSLPEGQLSDANKQIIWEAVKGRLGDMIQDGDQLEVLLSLPKGQLSDANKQIIWGAVKGRLAEIIQNGDQLKDLLSLLEGQLSNANKQFILKAVESQLVNLIAGDDELAELVSQIEQSSEASPITTVGLFGGSSLSNSKDEGAMPENPKLNDGP